MPSLPAVRYAALTDVGVRRSHNQDACAAQPAATDAHGKALGHIFVVADGMGGHAVGEKASAKAVRDIPLTYQKHVPQDGVKDAIRKAFADANAGIYEIGQKNPEFKGMGTTATALFLRTEGAWIGHVGDSRAYRIRRGKVDQLTFDHSWVWEIAKRQGVDPEELGDFKKNVIIRSLGPDAEVEVDIEGPYPVEPGDVFLLCSDGLSNLVMADEIGSVVNTLPPDEATKFLVDLANVRGGPDNITCVIVQVPGSGSNAVAAVAPEGGSAVASAMHSWGRRLAWHYAALGLGSVAVIGAIVLRTAEPTGAMGLFGLAALLVVAGVLGLVMHFRAAPGVEGQGGTDAADGVTSGQNVYKGYTFEIGQPLLDRFTEMDAMLKEALKSKDETGSVVDWAAHQRLADEVTARLAKAEFVPAFRARCLALQMLATVFNKDRNKEEAFQPNWTTPTRA